MPRQALLHLVLLCLICTPAVADICLPDDSPGKICTASDFTLTEQLISGPSECIDGTIITEPITLRLGLTPTSNTRYDIGLFVGEAGASPIGGASCIFDSLTPIENPPGSLFDGLSGFGPYRESTGNACGDTEKDDGQVFREVELTNILCQDLDNDGALDLPYAVTWKNQAEVCTDPTDASQFIPNQSSKCINWVGEVPEIPVLPPEAFSIEVAKRAVPNVIESGEDVTFELIVTNDGDVEVTLISLDDTVYGDVTLLAESSCSVPQSLTPGEDYACAFSEIVTGPIPSTHVNEITATARYLSNTEMASDTAEVAIIAADQGSIGQLVWSDLDADGIRDDDEPGLDGVTLDLLDSGGVVLASAVTSSGGEYKFTDLNSGSYTVTVTDVNQIVATSVLTGGLDPRVINLQVGEHYYDADFGYAKAKIQLLKQVTPGVISAPGELVTYSLTIANPGPLDITVTEIADVTVGSVNTAIGCAVPFPLAVGEATSCIFNQSLTGSPGDEIVNEAVVAARDVDGNVVFTQDEAVVMVVDGADASIGDFVWLDTNGDGIQDPGEQGINFVDLELWTDTDNDLIVDTLLDTVTTASSGEYSFVGLAAGAHQVRVPENNPALDGLYLSGGIEPRDILLAAAEVVENFDFGYTSIPTPAISVTKTALNPVVDAPGGAVTYEVTVSNTGPIPVTLDNLIDHRIGVLSQASFCSIPQVLPVGYSYSCEYSTTVTGDPGDNYFNAVTARAIDSSGQVAHGYDIAVVSIVDANEGAIGDSVWLDINANGAKEFWEPGIGNVSLSLFQGGNQIGTALTDNSGFYSFNSLPAGNYEVRVTDSNGELDGLLLTGGIEPRNLTLVSGQIVDDADFGYSAAVIRVLKSGDPQTLEAPGGSVDFSVTLANLGFVDVTLVSLVDDKYGDLAGSCPVGQVIPARGSVLCGFTADVIGTAGSQHINQVTATVEDPDGNIISDDDSFAVDLVAPPVGVVGILVWDDENGNGLREGSEPGIGSVTLDLREDTNADGIYDDLVSSTTTRSSGGYIFLPIPAGAFEVSVTDQYEILTGRVLTGGVEPMDVPLDPGEIFLQANFGYFQDPFIPPVIPPEPPVPSEPVSIPVLPAWLLWLLCGCLIVLVIVEFRQRRFQ